LFAQSGDDLVWRSIHTATTPGVNPTVSDLQIEWLSEHATIVAVDDVPDDQGGRVYIALQRSGHDFADVAATPATQYGLYRRVDNASLAASVAARAVAASEATPPLPGVETVWLDGTMYVLGSTTAAAAVFPPGIWAHVATIPATQTDDYVAEATTAADSSMSGANHAVYVVTTHTTTPSVWFISAPDSGYSVDNIAPAVPANFAITYNTGGGNTLSWDPSPDDDFQYFRVYRSSDPNFTPSPTTLVHATTSTGWADPEHDGGAVFYQVTALDDAGNESDPAVAGAVTAAPAPAPRAFALHANVPNPFNPATTIRYDVPHNGSRVSLRVYDVTGGLVRTLVDRVESAGEKSVAWNGRDDSDRPLASGVYFYRLAASGHAVTRRMVLLK
jgi:hypothetical protein